MECDIPIRVIIVLNAYQVLLIPPKFYFFDSFLLISSKLSIVIC